MKILVIPDCHLKPWMIKRAIEIKEEQCVETIVFLGDLVDDWDKEYDKDLYEETLNEMIQLVKKYPETKICMGNHDFGYLYHLPHSGYSSYVSSLVERKFKELMNLTDIKIIHKIDNIMFSHAGLCEAFINREYELRGDETIDEVIGLIENLPPEELWNNLSPIWVRPQYKNIKMYKDDEYIQVVGHTPTDNIYVNKYIISCDVFSTNRNGLPIGNQKFIIIDSKTGKIIYVGS